MRTPSDRLLRHGTERMLIVRVALALGLAVLLVIGAWSTSHRAAETHASLCLAPGASVSSAHHDHDPSAVEASPVDAAAVAIAALCCVLLVLLLRRLVSRGALPILDRRWRTITAPRAGPHRAVPALTLVQLSLSRT